MEPLDKPAPPSGLLTTDSGTSASDKPGDESRPLFSSRPEGEDAGGIEGKAGRGGPGSTLSHLSPEERSLLTELSKMRTYAHVKKVEEVMMSGAGMGVADADKRAAELPATHTTTQQGEAPTTGSGQ